MDGQQPGVVDRDQAGMTDLAQLAARARERVLRFALAQPVHLGASLSAVDILVAAYAASGLTADRTADPDRSRVVLSKGHAVWAQYAVLGEFGVPGLEQMRAGHPTDGVPGIDVASGALGHGLAIGAGLAMAARVDRSARTVTVVMGDGELDEGSVWEAALFCAHQRLGNLVAVVDRNGQQQEGPTEDVITLEPLADKWRAFGWDVRAVDGHDPDAMLAVLREPAGDRPQVLIAVTVKGKGVSFMEGDPSWHLAELTKEQLEAALAGAGVGAGRAR